MQSLQLTHFLENLRKGEYFPNIHKIIYELRVIEYQYRGNFLYLLDWNGHANVEFAG
jgi:hypothetical protein